MRTPKKQSKKLVANQLAIVTNHTPSVLESLQEELKGLKSITETPYKTGGVINNWGDVRKMDKTQDLIMVMGYVLANESFYHDASKKLGLTSYPEFSISGSTTSHWMHDIKLRLSIITHHDRKTELLKLIEEGKQFLTKEHQYEMYLKKVGTVVSNQNN